MCPMLWYSTHLYLLCSLFFQAILGICLTTNLNYCKLQLHLTLVCYSAIDCVIIVNKREQLIGT